MLLTITYCRPPATDLGYLLHKNPARPQSFSLSFSLSFGQAHVFKDHFARVRKKVALGWGARREIVEIALNRYACYLIAQNGDP